MSLNSRRHLVLGASASILLLLVICVTTALAGAIIVVKAASANLRSGPSTDYPVIGSVHQGQELSVWGVAIGGEWYFVRLSDGGEAWISAQVAGPRPNSTLYLRPVASRLPPPAKETPDRTNKFAERIDVTPEMESSDSGSLGRNITATSASVNVRAGPGAFNPAIGTLTKGEAMEAKGRTQDGRWIQVCCVDGKTGWVSASLVAFAGDVTELPLSADVPSAMPTSTRLPSGASEPKGTLFFTQANANRDDWELWQYDFASDKATLVKEKRSQVAFSRDGKKVLYYFGPPIFMSEQRGSVYMASAVDFSGERNVLGANIHANYPSFSPDMKRIVAQVGGNSSVFGLDDSGKKLSKSRIDQFPAWSPVDDWIASYNMSPPGQGLWLTNAASGKRVQLLKEAFTGAPAWSPDGKRLAFESSGANNSVEIDIINRDGTGRARLTNTKELERFPVWSPDGNWIAFRSNRGGAWAIWLMRSDGSDARRLADAPVLKYMEFEKMAWKP
jgi:uncharacterized protein YraI